MLSQDEFTGYDKTVGGLGAATLGWAVVAGHFLAVELVPARNADGVPVLSALAGIYPRS